MNQKKKRKEPPKKFDKRMSPGKKRKTVTVMLPVPIPGKGSEDAYEKTEHEIDYEDALLCAKLEKLASQGFTNDQIIARIGVSRGTFYERLKTDSYFLYCLNKHRGLAVLQAENALFQNVVGFEYTEQVATPAGVAVTVKKQKLPETKAIEFFLTNRASDQWKKKVETTIQPGEGMGAMTFIVKRREE